MKESGGDKRYHPRKLINYQEGKLIMANTKYTQIPRNWHRFVVLIAIYAGLSTNAIGKENIKIHDHIPPGDLAVSALAGKAILYTYVHAISITPYGEGEYEAISYGETVEVVFEEHKCTYLGLKGKFKGESEGSACGQKEIAPGIYFVSWLESSGQMVTLVINSDAMTVNSSFLSKGPRGLDNVEFLHGEMHAIGSIEEIKVLRQTEGFLSSIE